MKGMRDDINNIKLPSRLLRAILLGICLVYTNTLYAAFIPNAAVMLQNFFVTVPALMQLVTAFAYVMGMFLVIKGIMMLKQFGESRSMMSQEHSLKGPLLCLFAGAMLLYLPSSVQVGMSTFFQNPSPLGYLNDTSASSWTSFIYDVFGVIQLVGTISFIRGLIMLSHLGGHGGGQATFGKAMAHIIAGVFCINIYQFLQVVFNTLGYGQI